MPIELMVMLDDCGRLVPATKYDHQQLEGIGPGKPFKVTMTQQKPRSLSHHRMFFGGLLGLGFEYWEPAGGLVTAGERRGIESFADYLDRKRGSTVIREVADIYIQHLAQLRGQRIQAPNKNFEQFRRWVSIEAGYYDLQMSPNGPVKVAKSISWHNMDQTEFWKFYKAAFSVVWRLVLSQHFGSEEECQNAIDNLNAMG
ncbi:MAG: DUF1367 family protein [Shewanella sp.]